MSIRLLDMTLCIRESLKMIGMNKMAILTGKIRVKKNQAAINQPVIKAIHSVINHLSVLVVKEGEGLLNCALTLDGGALVLTACSLYYSGTSLDFP